MHVTQDFANNLLGDSGDDDRLGPSEGVHFNAETFEPVVGLVNGMERPSHAICIHGKYRSLLLSGRFQRSR